MFAVTAIIVDSNKKCIGYRCLEYKECKFIDISIAEMYNMLLADDEAVCNLHIATSNGRRGIAYITCNKDDFNRIYKGTVLKSANNKVDNITIISDMNNNKYVVADASGNVFVVKEDSIVENERSCGITNGYVKNGKLYSYSDKGFTGHKVIDMNKEAEKAKSMAEHIDGKLAMIGNEYVRVSNDGANVVAVFNRESSGIDKRGLVIKCSVDKIIIPDGVTIIPNGGFEHVNAKIKFSKSLVEICDGAFYANELIEEAVLPNSIKKIGASAFLGCIKLKHVELPDSLEYLGFGAFSLCRSLKTIYIPRQNFIGKENIPRGVRILYKK